MQPRSLKKYSVPSTQYSVRTGGAIRLVRLASIGGTTVQKVVSGLSTEYWVLSTSSGGPQVGEDGGGLVGVGDAVEGGVADETVAHHRHGQRLEADLGLGPLLRQAEGQAGLVVALDAQHHRVDDLVQAGRPRRLELVRPADRGD